MKNYKEIKEKLMNDGVKFSLKRKNQYSQTLNFIVKKYTFDQIEDSYTISRDEEYNFSSMNVEKFGSRKLYLYSFDMFNNKIIKTIHYDEIKFK